jgi:hypothetical protein
MAWPDRRNRLLHLVSHAVSALSCPTPVDPQQQQQQQLSPPNTSSSAAHSNRSSKSERSVIGAAIGSTIGPGGVAAVVLPAALRRCVII